MGDGDCTPCGTERKAREKLASPLFPAAFPCPHPQTFPVPGFTARYPGDRHCPGCAMLAAAEITVEGPGTIGYRCGQGHEWAAASLATSERDDDLPQPYGQFREPPGCVYGYRPGPGRGSDRHDQPDRDDDPQEGSEGRPGVAVLPRGPPDRYGEDDDEHCCTCHAPIVVVFQDQFNPRPDDPGKAGDEE